MHLTLTHQFNQLLRRLLVLFRHRQLSGKCALVLLGSTLVSTAQTNHPATSAAVSANRFLFIVETSAAIKPQTPSLLKVVGDLINSGANGQMHDGDTIGLWTY